ncbi:MAG TPA: protoporphyrinogen oxidase [Thermodesulfovibrionia bacterium]|nr:protoporphyrinogen oxidase [Thermodesulfovibrionia bacterium]
MKVVIVGAGISGLTTAYALLNSSQFSVLSSQFDITVYEADSRPGGKIWSDKTDGFLCEKGVNGFLDNKPKTLQLCDYLGLEPLKSSDNARRRFIFSSGKLNQLSESPLSFLKSDLISWRGKLRMIYELIAPKGPEDETVADFVIRRLGKESLEKLIDPMCSGIFAGDPYKMSIRHCFPRIKELEQNYGSLIRAMITLQKERRKGSGVRGQGSEVVPVPAGRLTSFYNGAQTITDTLAQRLEGKIRLGVSVKGIEKDGKAYKVHTSRGIDSADIVILASPAHASSEIIGDFDKKFSKILSEIPYAPVSVVCFGYKREKVLHSLQGFGFLIPHIEGKKILGTLWDSSIFPNRAPEGYVLLRNMIGGAKSPELAMLDDNAIIGAVFDELRPIVSLKGEPDIVRIYRWEKAIPQYVMGHGDRLKFIDESLKSYHGLYLTGNSYRGIGMNDCIENAYKLAEQISSEFPL